MIGSTHRLRSCARCFTFGAAVSLFVHSGVEACRRRSFTYGPVEAQACLSHRRCSGLDEGRRSRRFGAQWDTRAARTGPLTSRRLVPPVSNQLRPDLSELLQSREHTTQPAATGTSGSYGRDFCCISMSRACPVRDGRLEPSCNSPPARRIHPTAPPGLPMHCSTIARPHRQGFVLTQIGCTGLRPPTGSAGGQRGPTQRPRVPRLPAAVGELPPTYP